MKLPERKNPRASRYDYRSAGGYFVTICTKDREHYFGEIEDGKMKFSKLGKFCHDEIARIESNRKTVDIHEYVVIPNHVHILLVMDHFTSSMNQPVVNTRKRRDDLLGRPNTNPIQHGGGNDGVGNIDKNVVRDNKNGYNINENGQVVINENGHAAINKNGHAKSVSLQTTFNPDYEGPNLGSIINMFKGGITKYANAHNISFARQGRYHDYIIRNQDEYNRITWYIENNPKNWKDDKFWR